MLVLLPVFLWGFFRMQGQTFAPCGQVAFLHSFGLLRPTCVCPPRVPSITDDPLRKIGQTKGRPRKADRYPQELLTGSWDEAVLSTLSDCTQSRLRRNKNARTCKPVKCLESDACHIFVKSFCLFHSSMLLCLIQLLSTAICHAESCCQQGSASGCDHIACMDHDCRPDLHK